MGESSKVLGMEVNRDRKVEIICSIEIWRLHEESIRHCHCMDSCHPTSSRGSRPAIRIESLRRRPEEGHQYDNGISSAHHECIASIDSGHMIWHLYSIANQLPRVSSKPSSPCMGAAKRALHRRLRVSEGPINQNAPAMIHRASKSPAGKTMPNRRSRTESRSILPSIL